MQESRTCSTPRLAAEGTGQSDLPSLTRRGEMALPFPSPSSLQAGEIFTRSLLYSIRLYSDAEPGGSRGRQFSHSMSPAPGEMNSCNGKEKGAKKDIEDIESNRRRSNNSPYSYDDHNLDSSSDRGKLVMEVPLSSWSHKENGSGGTQIVGLSPTLAATPCSPTTEVAATSLPFFPLSSPSLLPPLPHLVTRLPCSLLPPPPPLPHLLSLSSRKRSLHPTKYQLDVTAPKLLPSLIHHSSNDPTYSFSARHSPSSSRLPPTSQRHNRKQVVGVNLHADKQSTQTINRHHSQTHSRQDRKQIYNRHQAGQSSEQHSSSDHHHSSQLDSLSLIESSNKHYIKSASNNTAPDRHYGHSRSQLHRDYRNDMTPTIFHPRKKHRAHANAGIYAPRRRRSERNPPPESQERPKRLPRGKLGREREGEQDETFDMEEDASDNDSKDEEMNQELTYKLTLQSTTDSVSLPPKVLLVPFLMPRCLCSRAVAAQDAIRMPKVARPALHLPLLLRLRQPKVVPRVGQHECEPLSLVILVELSSEC